MLIAYIVLTAILAAEVALSAVLRRQYHRNHGGAR